MEGIAAFQNSFSTFYCTPRSVPDVSICLPLLVQPQQLQTAIFRPAGSRSATPSALSASIAGNQQ
jgi:hypothetical protein